MKVAFFGIGLMGSRMAKRLLDAGHELTVFNRTVKKTRALREAGAAVAESPAQAVEAAEVIVAMVPDAPAIRELLFGPAMTASLAGKTFIQMSTIGPDESREFARLMAEARGDYLEAPVLGSIPQAEHGQLILMVGARPEQFERWLPFLSVLGSEPLLVGPVGKGAALKLAMNGLIAAMMAGFSISFGLAQRQGVPGAVYMDVLRRSALFAPMFGNKVENLKSRDFSNPNFPSRHLLKDVNLVLAAAQDSGLNAGVMEAVRDLIQAAMDRGHTLSDYSSMYEGVMPEEGRERITIA